MTTAPSPRPRALLSWSTGKDSAWALHVLRSESAVEVAGLVTTVIGADAEARVTMHGIGRATLAAQACNAGLPLFEVPLPDPCPNDAYERAMGAFVERARADGITHMAFGDLFLEDVRRYREDRLAGSGIAPLFPLWGRDTARLARDMLAGGLRARIVCVDTAALGEEFLGRDLDAGLLGRLPPGCDPCGENGEFHTFAYAGPMFARTLDIAMGRIRRKDRFVHIEPRAAFLEDPA